MYSTEVMAQFLAVVTSQGIFWNMPKPTRYSNERVDKCSWVWIIRNRIVRILEYFEVV